MPKIVDHDRRREEIVEAYLHVLGERGVSGTNGRTVAQALGVVPGTIWHYFDSVEQIAEAAARRGVQRTLDRIATRLHHRSGLAALVAIAEEILPVDDVTRTEARVVVAFWGQVTPDAQERRALGRVREFTELTRTALEQAVDAGDLQPSTPIRALVRQVDSVYAGEQVILAADTGSGSAADVRAVFAMAVAPWLTQPLRSETAHELIRWCSNAVAQPPTFH
ncbi:MULTISPECIES: TetR/AcrR family transcriptional regulator [unclassified Curtobacterium]|jgi:AcrR family transcriptional regulator|uniref:TetR/AcrR family transcriptional regulator n=1 Tax=unclassified Curtobacterium TaxID=257496 RepID=UPI0028676470|nr:TetR/AcrR family transcriptional regulator [Curtobacterium sp. 320]MDR6573591.1 AcrR family transcriptional regulator [Curtobacterium sp. 320]